MDDLLCLRLLFCELCETKRLYESTPRCLGLGRLLKLPQNTPGPVGVRNLQITVLLLGPFQAKQTGVNSERLQLMLLLHAPERETCPVVPTTTIGSVESYS